MRAPIFQTCSLQFHTYLSPPPHSFLEGAQHITRLLLGVHYATGRSLIQKISNTLLTQLVSWSINYIARERRHNIFIQ